jgi:hypothetical protein
MHVVVVYPLLLSKPIGDAAISQEIVELAGEAWEVGGGFVDSGSLRQEATPRIARKRGVVFMRLAD